MISQVKTLSNEFNLHDEYINLMNEVYDPIWPNSFRFTTYTIITNIPFDPFHQKKKEKENMQLDTFI